MTISLVLNNPSDTSIGRYSRGCDVADSGYSDISAGAPVTVKDDAGKVLASTFLESGIDQGPECLFTVTVQVPDSKFYQVEVSHRGVLTYTETQLVADGWTASLTLGS